MWWLKGRDIRALGGVDGTVSEAGRRTAENDEDGFEGESRIGAELFATGDEGSEEVEGLDDEVECEEVDEGGVAATILETPGIS